MLSARAFTAVIGACSLAGLLAGLWYPSAAYALGGTTACRTPFCPTGALSDENVSIDCTWSSYAGEWIAAPGDGVSIPPQVTHQVLAPHVAHCVGHTIDPAAVPPTPPGQGANEVNEGDFYMQIVFNLPICVSDSNSGHGNETCYQLDPQNTGKGPKKLRNVISAEQSGVFCSAVNGGNDYSAGSYLDYLLYCEQGVSPDLAVDWNNSYLEWVSTSSYPNPPTWTHCTGTPCKLILGGLPRTMVGGNWVTDDTECQNIFQADSNFNLAQILSYREWYNGACVDAHTPPDVGGNQLGGVDRFCDSANFDNTFQRCPPISVTAP